jgi:hypothetical protein
MKTRNLRELIPLFNTQKEHMYNNNDSRRQFLKDSALVTAAATLPSISSFARSNLKAGDKVKLACIGIGNQGASDLMQFHKGGHS